MKTKPFRELRISSDPLEPVRRRYSVTADIVAFRRCPRQYGAFRVDNYAPAHQTQIYYGTVIHQVLDRCHLHYHGQFDSATKGTLPDEGQVRPKADIEAWFKEVDEARREGKTRPPAPTDILRFFLDVEEGLRSRGIRPVSPDLRVRAVVTLQNFNALEGPELYPRVVDTEHQLQASQQTHILHGVIDLLVDAPGRNDASPGDREMWDYKGVDPESLKARDRQTYEFQMRVYARLYEIKHGVLPKRALLYFVNQLYADSVPSKRPANAVMEVSLDPADVEEAVTAFATTVEDVERAREAGRWDPAEVGTISEKDCTICDLRWDCPTPNQGNGVKMRYP